MKIHISLLLLLISVTQITAFAQVEDWTTPIGIPVPPFGINETYRMYDDADKRASSGLTYQESAGGGYFTHYVDANASGSTDSSNAYGSIAKPRKTVPNTMPAGSIVEIHSVSTVSFYRLKPYGTEELPVFIRGVNKPSIPNSFSIADGQYAIVEGFLFNNVGVNIRGVSDTPSTRMHHISVRNNEIRGAGVLGQMGARVCVGSTSSPFPAVDNIVVYNNEIHHWGDCSPTSVESGNDGGGVHVGSYTTYLWILNNNIHSGGGDSILLCHGANFTSSQIYIGGNVMYNSRENAIDIKQCNDVIVSQNELYGNVPTSSSAGEIVVIHYDPNRISFLFNKIHDGTYGIVSTGCKDQYIIGNVIYNITGTYSSSTPYSPHRQGIGIRWYNTGKTYVLSNTLYNCITGIGADILTYPTTIVNNVISQRKSDTDGYHLSIQGKGLADSIMENNLFYQPGELSRIFWGGIYNGVANFQASTGKGAGCIETNPMFVDSLNGDFDLQQSSPVNNLQASSQAQAVYDRFLQLYGVDLAADIAGKERTLYVPPSVPDSTDTSSTNSSSEDVLPNNTDTSNTASSNADVLPDNSIDTGITQETQNSSPVVADTANQVTQSSGTESSNTATNNTSDASHATNTSPTTSTSQPTGTTQITGNTQVSNSGTQDNSRRSRMTGFITTKITPKKIFGRYDDIYNTAKRGWTVKKEYFE